MPSVAESRAAQAVGGLLDPRISAASLRGPMRGEILVITLQTAAARVYNVPMMWKGRIVNLYADGADVYIQVSTGTDANLDPDAVAVETLNGSRYDLTPSASGNGCWRIPHGQWIPVAFGTDAQTFALRGTASGKLRTHVAET